MAEAVAGQRLDERRLSQPVPAEGFLRLADWLESSPATRTYARWAQWFLRVPLTRPVSPRSLERPSP